MTTVSTEVATYFYDWENKMTVPDSILGNESGMAVGMTCKRPQGRRARRCHLEYEKDGIEGKSKHLLQLWSTRKGIS